MIHKKIHVFAQHIQKESTTNPTSPTRDDSNFFCAWLLGQYLADEKLNYLLFDNSSKGIFNEFYHLRPVPRPTVKAEHLASFLKADLRKHDQIVLVADSIDNEIVAEIAKENKNATMVIHHPIDIDSNTLHHRNIIDHQCGKAKPGALDVVLWQDTRKGNVEWVGAPMMDSAFYVAIAPKLKCTVNLPPYENQIEHLELQMIFDNNLCISNSFLSEKVHLLPNHSLSRTLATTRAKLIQKRIYDQLEYCMR
ncbi:MAG: hypothetical protein R3Y10_07315 [Ferrimonas sp.]